MIAATTAPMTFASLIFPGGACGASATWPAGCSRRWAFQVGPAAHLARDSPHPDRDSLERRHAIHRKTPPPGHLARDTEPGCACHGIRITTGPCPPGANRSGWAHLGSRRSGTGLAPDTRRSRSPRDPRVGEGRPGVPARTLSTDRLGGRMAHAPAWHTSRRALTAATRSIARQAACAHRVFAPRLVAAGAPR